MCGLPWCGHSASRMDHAIANSLCEAARLCKEVSLWPVEPPWQLAHVEERADPAVDVAAERACATFFQRRREDQLRRERATSTHTASFSSKRTRARKHTRTHTHTTHTRTHAHVLPPTPQSG
eukprot:4261003-Pleurochrysis_carterae.AAC.4